MRMRSIHPAFMTPAEATQTQKPYRYGMILLCFGALINWVGLAENYTEPIRYAGVACIVGGALLICTAMCCWLQSPNRISSNDETDDPIHIISTTTALSRSEKPPEYETVVMAPPNYDDAIKLDPMALLQAMQSLDKDAVPSYDCATSSTVASASSSSSSTCASVLSSPAHSSVSVTSSAPTATTLLGQNISSNNNNNNNNTQTLTTVSIVNETTYSTPKKSDLR